MGTRVETRSGGRKKRESGFKGTFTFCASEERDASGLWEDMMYEVMVGEEGRRRLSRRGE
jgi:hypothetical protein